MASLRRSARALWLAAAVAVVAPPSNAAAWIFHEHQVIGERAIQGLTPVELHRFDGLWQQVRALGRGRLCRTADLIEHDGEGRPTCVSFAALPAIAGDHSCSAEEMWKNTVTQDWMLDVIQIANETREQLMKARARGKLQVWNYSNLLLERADPAYSARAANNFTHFALPRASTNFESYMRRSLKSDVNANAAATYAFNHWAALSFALEHARLPADSPRRKELLRLSLTAEAYAVHFLQDAFSSGHVVGRGESVSEAKGTHDHYCVEGIDAVTWEGKVYSAYGDAHMRPRDLKHAAAATRASFRQLLAAFGADPRVAELMRWLPASRAPRYRDSDSCKEIWVKYRVPSQDALRLAGAIWRKTLVPSLGEGEAKLPRFNAEIGPFVGFASNLRVGMAFAGYDTESPGSPRFDGGIDVHINFGYGLEGATGLSSDGTFMLGVGLLAQGNQFDGSCDDCQDVRSPGANVPRVPSRMGLTFVARMPFFLIPGDLLILLPAIAPFSTVVMKRAAITAADGGLIPWQTTFLTRAGDFQFVLGREVKVTLFGIIGDDIFFRYLGQASPSLEALNFKSVLVEFPLVQWRIFRFFSKKLTSAVLMTVGGAFDIPYDVETVIGNAPRTMNPSWMVYFRVGVDGRIYFN